MRVAIATIPSTMVILLALSPTVPARAEDFQVLGGAHARGIIPVKLVVRASHKPDIVYLGVSNKNTDGSVDRISSVREGRILPVLHVGPGQTEGCFELHVLLVADYQRIGPARMLFPEAGTYELEWSFRLNLEGRSVVNGGPENLPEEVARIRHSIVVQPALSSDVGFLRGCEDAAVRTRAKLMGRSSSTQAPDKEVLEGMVVRGVLEAVSCGRMTILETVRNDLAGLSEAFPNSTYAGYVAYALGYLNVVGEVAKAKAKRTSKPFQGLGIDVSTVVGMAKRAYRHADPLLKPRALALRAAATGLSGEVEAAAESYEVLHKEHSLGMLSDPASRVLLKIAESCRKDMALVPDAVEPLR